MSTSATDPHTKPYVGEYIPSMSADATALAMLGRHKRYHSEIVLRCSLCGARGAWTLGGLGPDGQARIVGWDDAVAVALSEGWSADATGAICPDCDLI